jgi:hypothetical protein
MDTSNVTLGEVSGTVDRVVLLFPHLAIQVISWLQVVLSLNRFRGFFLLTTPELVGLGMYTTSAVIRWAASLAARNAAFYFQLSLALVSAMLGWGAFVIIYNDRIELPTRQQMSSIGLVVLVTVLWEVVTRLLFLV